MPKRMITIQTYTHPWKPIPVSYEPIYGDRRLAKYLKADVAYWLYEARQELGLADAEQLERVMAFFQGKLTPEYVRKAHIECLNKQKGE